MTSLDAAQFEDVVTTAWQSAIDRFKQLLGPLHYSNLKCRLEYIQMVESFRGLEQPEVDLQKLVRECEAACGPRDVRTLKLLDTLGETLMEQGKHAEAEVVGRKIVTRASLVKPHSK